MQVIITEKGYRVDLHGSQVVGVGNKEVFLPVGQQLVEDALLGEGIEKIAVTGRVPACQISHVSYTAYMNIPPVLLVVIGRLRARKETLLENTRIATLVKGNNPQLLVSVFLDNAKGIVVGVE